MRKRMCLLLIGTVCAVLLFLTGGTALAENPASPTDLDPTEPPEDWVIEGDVLIACNSQAVIVKIPDGIREIGPNAFRGLERLQNVIMPDSVEIIGECAFADCKRLKAIVLSDESKLKEIRSKAFLNCKKLKTDFVPDGVKVAADAFEGAGPEETPTMTPAPETPTPAAPTKKPKPTPTPDAPTKKPKPTPTPAPTKKPKPTPTPSPTPAPTKDHEPPATGTPEPDPEPEPEPDPPHYGGGGGSSKPKIPHSRNTDPAGPDYDLLDLKNLTEKPSKATNQLTFGSETLSLALNRPADAEYGDGFTVAGKDWRQEDGNPRIDTLILTAAKDSGEGKQDVWSMNGEVLRRMNKSGIEHLVLRSGDEIAVMETEGFLAGWNYDEMKSRGTANRRFEYEIDIGGGAPAAWLVQVEGQTYELTTDEHAGIFMTGVYSGSAEALDEPYDNLASMK